MDTVMAAKLEHQVHPGTVLENSSNNLIGQTGDGVKGHICESK
jgi:hypothetical protein